LFLLDSHDRAPVVAGTGVEDVSTRKHYAIKPGLRKQGASRMEYHAELCIYKELPATAGINKCKSGPTSIFNLGSTGKLRPVPTFTPKTLDPVFGK
jgi:hypothetical protein